MQNTSSGLHDWAGDSQDPKARLSWESIDNNIYQLDEQTLTVCLDRLLSNLKLTLQPLRPPVEGDASLPYDILNLRNYSLAVSGDVFRWIIDYAPVDILQRVSHSTVVAARLDLLMSQRC